MIRVAYRFPAGVDAEKQAQVIAIGQTAGSWGAQFSHRESRLRAHLGTVLEVRPEGDGALAWIGFPEANTEGDLGTLLTMIFGKFSLAGPARVVDLQLPDGYGTPAKFGIPGLRRLTGVRDRPLFMAIFKPALGLTADDHAGLLREVASAGLDLIKDDEILGDLPDCPTLERVRACRPVIDEASRHTGREILYAVNLTGPVTHMAERARDLIDAGANALLLNVLVYGYPVLEALAADPAVNVPIFAHPALAGAMGGAADGSSDYGIDYGVLLGTLMRYGGADAVLHPACYGSLPFAAATQDSIRDRLRETIDGRPAAMPVPSAGIHPGVLDTVLNDYGDDVVLNAGSGIFDHPEGPAAGVEAFFTALKCVREGTPLQVDALPAGPLRTALNKWGGRS